MKEITSAKSQHKLEEIAEYVKPESELNKVIESVSKKGEAEHYDWKTIKPFILFKVKETILSMQSSYPDFRPRPGESFDDQLDSIIQSYMAFEEK